MDTTMRKEPAIQEAAFGKTQERDIPFSRLCPRLCLVVPCYNEASVLPVMLPVFQSKLEALIKDGRIRADSVLLLVNDGSSDQTWPLICRASRESGLVKGLSLSRNRGHQNALAAGLMEARTFCDAAVSMDCDGQDDIRAIDSMLEAYGKGAEIVYGVRMGRATDTWFKRVTAQGFYRLMSWLGGDCVYNHADYRLLGRAALDAFSEFHEVNLFLRGLFPMIGFKSEVVSYERKPRKAGKSHYPFRRMAAFAADGITSFSIRPIRLVMLLGGLVSLGSLAGIIYAFSSVAFGHVVSEWASMVCIVCLLGGVQLLSIGVIGEYVGKIYLETKGRPRYIIADRTWDPEACNFNKERMIMTILEEFDESKEAVVNPCDLIKPLPDMPKIVVSCFAKETFERMVSSFGGERVGETREANMVIPVYKTVCKGIPVGMYMSAVGAPACVSVAEEIFAMGAEVIILFGTCGVLNKEIHDCSIIIPDRALRDEGTSYHYGPASEEIAVNPRYREDFEEILQQLGCKYTIGKTWTSDGIYRETKEKVASVLTC